MTENVARLTSVEFRAWMGALHMDMAQASIALGVSHDTARHWWHGKRPIPYGVLGELQKLDAEISDAAEAAVEAGVVRVPVGDMHAARVAARALIYAEGSHLRIEAAPSRWLITTTGGDPVPFVSKGKPDATEMAQLIYNRKLKASFAPQEAWQLAPGEVTLLLVETPTKTVRHPVARDTRMV